MAAPTAAADTAAAPPPPGAGPPPPPEPTPTPAAEQKVSDAAAQPDVPPSAPAPAPAQAPAPAPAPPPAPAAKRRKLEDAGFHTSAYYQIRATISDLRLRFVQVYEATDSRKDDAAREILKEIKVVMELSKKMRLDLGATSDPVKPQEKPLVGAVKDGPAEPPPSAENNHGPQTDQTTIPPNNANNGAPPEPENSESVAPKM